MRMMTRSELAGRNANELSALFQTVSKGLTRADDDRRNALANLEIIRRVRAALLACQQGKSGPAPR